jgi:hypothetical protein
MAKKPAKSVAPGVVDLDEIDAGAQYTVTLTRSVKHGATWLRPGSARLRLSGATLIEIADAVGEFEIVK